MCMHVSPYKMLVSYKLYNRNQWINMFKILKFEPYKPPKTCIMIIESKLK